MSKSQLNQKLHHKAQIFIFQFLFNFGRKNLENLWLTNDHFLTIFGHFFANYINLSQNWVPDGHFEMLSMFKSWLDQELTYNIG